MDTLFDTPAPESSGWHSSLCKCPRCVTEKAMQTAEANASKTWKEHVRRVIEELALDREPFTSDDIHDRIDPEYQTLEKRAMGPILRAVAKDGKIRKLDQVRVSRRPEAHQNPKQVWVGQ